MGDLGHASLEGSPDIIDDHWEAHHLYGDTPLGPWNKGVGWIDVASVEKCVDGDFH